MADTFKPARILTERGREIFWELEEADQNRDLLRCIAEAIARLENRFYDSLTPEQQVLYPGFSFYEEKEEK